jgi:hypothetical protein
MLEVKEAIYAKIAGDTGPGSLTDLLGTHSMTGTVRFFQGWPEVAEEYPMLTYSCVDEQEDAYTTFFDELYQFSIWSADPDLSDRIAARLRALFHRGSIPDPHDPVRMRIDSCLKFPPSADFPPDEQGIRQKVQHYKTLGFRLT